MPQDILDRLKREGHRITESRRNILEILATTHTPLTTAELVRELRQNGHQADKVTVYRELAFLEGQGIVAPVQLNDRAKRYELADLGHHHHLVCVKCDTVQDVDVKDDFAQAEKSIKKRTGFTVTRHALEFFGTCARCA